MHREMSPMKVDIVCAICKAVVGWYKSDKPTVVTKQYTTCDHCINSMSKTLTS